MLFRKNKTSNKVIVHTNQDKYKFENAALTESGEYVIVETDKLTTYIPKKEINLIITNKEEK